MDMLAVYECGVCNHRFELNINSLPSGGAKITCTQCMSFFYLQVSNMQTPGLDQPIVEALSPKQPISNSNQETSAQPSSSESNASHDQGLQSVEPAARHMEHDFHESMKGIEAPGDQEIKNMDTLNFEVSDVVDEYSSVQEDETQIITSPFIKENVEEDMEINEDEEVSIELAQPEDMDESDSFDSSKPINLSMKSNINQVGDFTDPEAKLASDPSPQKVPKKSSISDLISDSIGVEEAPEGNQKSAFTSSKAFDVSYTHKNRSQEQPTSKKIPEPNSQILSEPQTSRYSFRNQDIKSQEIETTEKSSKIEKYLLTLSLVVIAGTLVAFFLVYMKDNKAKQNEKNRLEQILLDEVSQEDPDSKQEPKQKFGFQKPQ